MKQTKDQLSAAAAVLGSIRSERKAKSSRENGKLGGRPPQQKRSNMEQQEERIYVVYAAHRYNNMPAFFGEPMTQAEAKARVFAIKNKTATDYAEFDAYNVCIGKYSEISAM